MFRPWQMIVMGAAVVLLLSWLFIPRNGQEEGVVGDGPVAEITDERVCLRYPEPPPSRRMETRCYRVPEDAEVENSIEKGDVVRVRRIDGRVVSVQAFPLD